MYERFTDRARKVMKLANDEALSYNHGYVGTKHILLGLIKEGGGVAANVLKNLDLDLVKIRIEVARLAPVGHDKVEPSVLPHSPRAEKAIDDALKVARALNHNYVGTEHLLLGLLGEKHGGAVQVLTNLGLTPEAICQEVLNLLGHGI
jgi:ATP-dependent Clp protease ATP-binding subunit ClpC